MQAQFSDHHAESSGNNASQRAQTDSNSLILDNNHPLYIHASDGPGTVIVSQVLTGCENYSLWSRGMRMSLIAKNKLGFIDGSCTEQTYGEELAHIWTRCNAMVQSWIVNSVSKELIPDILYSENAHEVWNDLKERFDKVNGSREFFLHQSISNCKQGGDSVPVYYSRLKHLWDEYSSLVFLPPCVCQRSLVILPPCVCRRAEANQRQTQQQRLFQFLNGLNDSYNNIRSQILLMAPLPSTNQAYAMIIQEETQRTHMAYTTSSNEQGNGAAFAVKNQVYRGKDITSVCSHCNFKGHKKENCYQLIGYPSDSKPRGRKTQNQRRFRVSGGNAANAGANVAKTEFVEMQQNKPFLENGGSAGNHVDTSPAQRNTPTEKDSTMLIPFSKEMYQQLQHMLRREAPSTSTENTAAAGSLRWSGTSDW